ERARPESPAAQRSGSPLRSKAKSGTIRMSGSTAGASGRGTRMPQTPAIKGSPNAQARMIRGWPRPATTGSASRAPAAASLRISGTGLISLLSGEKPETMLPGWTASGNSRPAIVSAARARWAAGNASRRSSASRRREAFTSAGGAGVIMDTSSCANVRSSAEPRWPPELRSRVPYESRWAPYVRAHEPGQGQLPSGSIRPRGYDSVAPRSPARLNLIAPPAQRHHPRPAPALRAIRPARRARLAAGRLVEPLGDALDALSGGIKGGGDGRLGRPGVLGGRRSRVLQAAQFLVEQAELVVHLGEF